MFNQGFVVTKQDIALSRQTRFRHAPPTPKELHDLPQTPRSSACATPDHDSVGPGILKSNSRIVASLDVAIDDNRN
jgi:hypothetical protein